MEAGAGCAPQAVILAAILGKEAMVDIAKLIVRSAHISWYICCRRGIMGIQSKITPIPSSDAYPIVRRYTPISH